MNDRPDSWNTPPDRVDRIADSEAFATFTRAGVAMILTDPSLPDNPIVYVNDAFERVTGYSRASAIGRNCRFLQGERTDPDHVQAIRDAVREGRETTVDILNYRADGTPFRNRLLIAPVHGPDGEITHFLGVQKELSPEEMLRSGGVSREEALREIQHRVKNHLAMVVGMIRLEARRGPAEAYDSIARRVESLQLLYEELSHAGRTGHGDRLSLSAYLGRICSAVAHLDGRPGLSINIDMEPVTAPAETAARIGLVVSEVVTNALEHAFEGRDHGALRVSLRPSGEGGARIETSDDGVGLPPGVTWPDARSLGGRIVLGLVDGMNARLDVDSGPTGTRVTLEVPALA